MPLLPVPAESRERLQRTVYREFLTEPGLAHEVGLESLPTKLASRLGCSADEAVEKLLEAPFLEALTLAQLQQLVAIRDMALISRTAAALSAELKEPEVTYEACCRTALIYAAAGMEPHVFAALRAAAAKHDEWARHHYLYGLLLGMGGDADRAMWELGMALSREPYEDGRIRVRQAMELLEPYSTRE